MELRHLRYFVAAAEAENVSRAALKVHVSQPALSRQIRDLEEELGFALFERSAKAVRLTEAGKVFLGEARAVLERAVQAVKAARAVASGEQGELHVGYAPSPTARLIPQALRAFQARRPEVRVKLHDLSTEEMLAGVREGELQLAFLARPSRAMLRGLRFEELMSDTLCLAVPPNHPLARSRAVMLEQAVREPLLAFNRRDYPEYEDHLAGVFAGVRARPRIIEEHDSAADLITAVESGRGAAVVPRSFSCFTGPRLKLLALLPAPAPLVIGAVWARRGLTGAAEEFLRGARGARSENSEASGER
jgi:DNA-binding transcriptional LysR family regulator